MKKRKENNFLIIFVTFLSIVVFFLLKNDADTLKEANLQYKLDKYSDAIEKSVDSDIHVLYSFESLFDIQKKVSRKNFKTFTKRVLEKHKSIEALEWVPIVSIDEIESYEKEAIKDVKNFKIAHLTEKEFYYPVYYIEPYKNHEQELGSDLGALNIRLKALLEAQNSKNIIASSRITLANDKNNKSAFLTFLSIRDKNKAIGFIVGIHRYEDIIKNALKNYDLSDINIDVYDITTKRDLLYATSIKNDTKLHKRGEFSFFNRKLEIVISMQKESLLEEYYIAYSALFLGLLLSTFIFYRDRLIRINQNNLIALNNKLQDEYNNSDRELKKQKYALDEHAIVAITDVKGTITYVNQKFIKISAYKKEELLGQNHRIINSGVHSADFWKDMYRNVSHNKTWHGEVCNKAKDGSLYWLETTIVPFLDKNKKPISYVSIRTDITKRKEDEEILHKKDKQLLEQSRLAQMGEMISMIAHQWRQPLGTIASTSLDLNMKIELETYNLENELERKNCQNYFSNRLQNIEELTQNLTKTIDDFRSFYKPNELAKKVQVDTLIKKVFNIIGSSFEMKNIKVIGEYNSVKEFELQDSEMMQVILNILKNAEDNFKKRDISNATIWISTEDIDNGMNLVICDNGGGINDENITKIFDPYFSTKNQKNGVGLGLYMSKLIVEEHHSGKLIAFNKNNGVCFKINFMNDMK